MHTVLRCSACRVWCEVEASSCPNTLQIGYLGSCREGAGALRIPSKWGHLVVSRAAHSSCGMRLSAVCQVRDHSEPKPSKYPPNGDIWVLQGTWTNSLKYPPRGHFSSQEGPENEAQEARRSAPPHLRCKMRWYLHRRMLFCVHASACTLCYDVARAGCGVR